MILHLTRYARYLSVQQHNYESFPHVSCTIKNDHHRSPTKIFFQFTDFVVQDKWDQTTKVCGVAQDKAFSSSISHRQSTLERGMPAFSRVVTTGMPAFSRVVTRGMPAFSRVVTRGMPAFSRVVTRGMPAFSRVVTRGMPAFSRVVTTFTL